MRNFARRSSRARTSAAASSRVSRSHWAKYATRALERGDHADVNRALDGQQKPGPATDDHRVAAGGDGEEQLDHPGRVRVGRELVVALEPCEVCVGPRTGRGRYLGKQLLAGRVVLNQVIEPLLVEHLPAE